jgi:paraquat-inducible protein A
LPHRLIACHECDLLQRVITLEPGGEAICPRCGAELYRDNPHGPQRTLALLLASAVAFGLANAFPIVSIDTQGLQRSASLFSAVHTLWDEEMPIVAVLVFVTTLLAPAFEIFALIFILSAVILGWRLPGLAHLLRLAVATRPWSMVEVLMLGVLVSVVKLSHLAHITPGIALWSFGALIMLFAAAMASLDTHDLWERLNSS